MNRTKEKTYFLPQLETFYNYLPESLHNARHNDTVKKECMKKIKQI